VSSGSAAGRDTGGLFAAIDAQDGAAFVSFLTDDAVFRFGSASAVQGRAAVPAAVEGFFDGIAGLSHSIDRTLGDDGHLIAAKKIYIDISPLYAD
jgi:ketosteroid isomerase-like protein